MTGRALLPRFSGHALSVMRRVSGYALGRAAIGSLARDALGISALGSLPEPSRAALPIDPRPIAARRDTRRWADAGLPVPTRTTGPRSIDALIVAYRAGKVRPSEVAARATDELERWAARHHDPVELCVAHAADAPAEARAADARWLRGEARALEGVPLLVKDVLDMRGLPTRMGASPSGRHAERDATVVARLRDAGGVALGKASMTELGISPLGVSMHHRLPRNAHRRGHVAGGSSTSSAVAVALGIVPLASGSDAGGSVRVPASLNGLFGLKPTFGRVSRAGEVLGGSVNHVGAIGVCTADLAHFLDAVALAPDSDDPCTAWAAPAPAAGFGARLGDGVRGLRVGIDEAEWQACDPAIAQRCRDALGALERAGATLVPVHVALAGHALAIGVATVGAEGAALAREVPAELAARLGDDVRLAMNVGASMGVGDFIDIQRLRGALARQLAAVLADVDVLALPTVASGAPRAPVRVRDGAASDASVVSALCRYAFLANLSGLPAGTVPVGFDPDGVPIGLQIVGDAWDEAGVLAVMAHLERLGFESPRAPGALDLLA